MSSTENIGQVAVTILNKLLRRATRLSQESTLLRAVAAENTLEEGLRFSVIERQLEIVEELLLLNDCVNFAEAVYVHHSGSPTH